MIQVLPMKMSKFYEVSKVLELIPMAEFNISFVGLVTAKPTTAGSTRKSGCVSDVKLI